LLLHQRNVSTIYFKVIIFAGDFMFIIPFFNLEIKDTLWLRGGEHICVDLNMYQRSFPQWKNVQIKK